MTVAAADQDEILDDGTDSALHGLAISVCAIQERKAVRLAAARPIGCLRSGSLWRCNLHPSGLLRLDMLASQRRYRETLR